MQFTVEYWFVYPAFDSLTNEFIFLFGNQLIYLFQWFIMTLAFLFEFVNIIID